MSTPARSYLLPAATLVLPPQMAAPLLVLLRPGRREWGGAIPVDLVQWLADLEQLAGQAGVHVDVRSPVVQWITVPDAAEMLGLSIRQTTALAPKLGGRKAGKRWMLPEDVVLEEVAARAAAYGGRTGVVVA